MPRVTLVVTALLIVVSFVLGDVPLAEAQPGFITGVVRDPAGDPIADADIVAENPVTNRRLEDSTNGAGRFSFVLVSGRWLFTVSRRGYEPVQGLANITARGNLRVSFVLERDPVRPPAPDSGVLANLQADELQTALDAADAHFQNGDYDAAIEGYEALLSTVPSLTALRLQIGHAYEAKQEIDSALASYRAITSDDPVSTEAQAAIDALLSDGGDR